MLLNLGADLASEDKLFAQYVSAHLSIAEGEWDEHDPATVTDALTDLFHKSEESEAVAKLALWILVEEMGTVSAAKHFLTEKTWDSYSFREVFPYLSFGVQDLRDILTPLSVKVKGDLASSTFYDIAQSWARLHPQVAKFYLDVEEEAAPIDFALELLRGMAQTEMLEAVVNYFHLWIGREGQLKYLALHLIPTLYERDQMTFDEGLDHVAENLRSQDVEAAEAAIFALRWLAESKVTMRLLDLLKEAIHDTRNEIKWRVSRFIWTCKKEEIETLGAYFLQTVVDMDGNLLGLIDNVDYVLSKYAESDLGVVEWFLGEWITHHSQDEPRLLIQKKRFPHTFYRLRSQHPNFTQNLGTRWMFAEAQFAKVGAFFLSEFKFSSFAPAVTAQLTDVEFTCLVERTLAFYFDPLQRFNLLRSLFPACDSGAKVNSIKAAYKELTLNYPGAAEKFLSALVSENDFEMQITGVIRHVFTSYYEPRAELSCLKEFYPQRGRVDAYYRFQNKRQAEANKAIDESGEFVLRQLATKVDIGRGDAWVINRPDGPLDEPSKFASFSYEMEAPRLEVLDPDMEAHRRIVRIHRLKPAHETDD